MMYMSNKIFFRAMVKAPLVKDVVDRNPTDSGKKE